MNEQDKSTDGSRNVPAAAPPEKAGDMKEVTTLMVIGSVFRAWFGVQTEENRKRDFNSNKPGAFIVAGIIFTLIMIIGVIIAVNIALSGAGK